MSRSSSRGRRHRPWYRRLDARFRRRVLWGLAGLVVIAILVLAVQAQRAVSSLRVAANQAQALQDQIAAGDDAGARATLEGLKESTRKARSASGGILWRAGSHVPVLGRNLTAVSTVSTALDDIAAEALPPIVDVAGRLNAKTFSPRDGRLDLEVLSSIQPAVEAADRSLVAAEARVASIDADSLLIPLRDPVRTITDRIASARSVAGSGRLATRLLPTMLGASQDRRYLLLVQNNAEIRSTGGIVGAFAVIDAKDGALSVVRTGNVLDLPPFTSPVVKPTKGELAVYSTSMFTDLRDVTFTPDFPRSAQIAQQLVEQGLDTTIDGVISIDPVALGYVLEGTGTVKLSAGFEIGSQNAATALLNQVYLAFKDPREQDDFYADATERIFDTVSSGQGDPRVTIAGLVRASLEGRLMVWSAQDAEQEVLADTALGGGLAGDTGAVPQIGVYLNDGASTKMEYYLEHRTSARSTRCVDDRQEITTRTELTSTAPDDLRSSVTGDGTYVEKGSMLLNVRLYAPHGGYFTSVELDGEPVTLYADRHRGRPVTRASVTLPPGETREVVATLVTGVDQVEDGVLSSSPGLASRARSQVVESSC